MATCARHHCSLQWMVATSGTALIAHSCRQAYGALPLAISARLCRHQMATSPRYTGTRYILRAARFEGVYNRGHMACWYVDNQCGNCLARVGSRECMCQHAFMAPMHMCRLSLVPLRLTCLTLQQNKLKLPKPLFAFRCAFSSLLCLLVVANC